VKGVVDEDEDDEDEDADEAEGKDEDDGVVMSVLAGLIDLSLFVPCMS
jgi:hypothetical protein